MSILKAVAQFWMDNFAKFAGAASEPPLRIPSAAVVTLNAAKKVADDRIQWVDDSTDPLQPLYFVRREDMTFAVADPQPSLFPKPDWMARIVAKQISFLLSQAPMMDAPDGLERAAHSVTKFAYVNPKTFAKFTRGAYSPKTSAPFVRIKPSPTKWVLTTMMPEDRVIYTPNPIPGLEKLLAD